MASPTADEILEIFEDLNYPSATKLRAALLKKGFKARLKDVEDFIKSQTPTQLFAKGDDYEEPEVEEGEPEPNPDDPHPLLAPSAVYALEASDAALQERVMTLPESAVSGTENSEEAFTSRLQAYRARNT